MEGNVQKMREAVADFVAAYEEDSDIDIEMMSNAYEKAKSSLSEPPRNCDVGTAEEQAERLFRRYGDTTIGAEVALLWAAMPYDEGGAE